MHIFLQGPRNEGKSTVIRKILEIISARRPLILGGFFTWNGGKDDPHVYMRPADSVCDNDRGLLLDSLSVSNPGDILLASWDDTKRGLTSDISAFDDCGARLLSGSAGVDLVIMDELGFLESKASLFKKAVLDTLERGVPVLGVLRLGDVPWHEDIKRSPLVSLYDVTMDNRERLPGELAELLLRRMRLSHEE